MAIQFSILLGSPFLDGPVPVGQHLRAHLDDTSKGAAGEGGGTEHGMASGELRMTRPEGTGREGHPPVVLFVGVGAHQRGHAVAQHHVGKVKHLLDVRGAVRTPAHVVVCRDEEIKNKMVKYIRFIKRAGTFPLQIARLQTNKLNEQNHKRNTLRTCNYDWAIYPYIVTEDKI